MLAEGVISTVGPVLLLAGAVVLVISLGRLLRRRDHPADTVGRRNGDAGARLREAADRELSRIEECGRGARAEIETKIHVLNGLLVRAEKAIGRLDRLRGPQGPQGPQGPAQGGGGTTAPPASSAPRAEDARFVEVYRLADRGVDLAEIAARTEFERGEVELILGLRAGGRPKDTVGPEETT